MAQWPARQRETDGILARSKAEFAPDHLFGGAAALDGDLANAALTVPISKGLLPHGSAARILNSPLTIAMDVISVVLASVAAGIGYHKIALQSFGDPLQFAVIGAVIGIFFVSACRLLETGQGTAVSTGNSRAGQGVIAWALSFGLLCLLLFALRAGISVSRGFIGTLFLLGMPWVVGVHAHVPSLLAHVTGQGKLSARRAIVIGNAGSASLGELHAEFGRGRYAQPTILEFDATAPSVAWPVERSALLTRVLEAAHKTDVGDIFVMADRVSGERLAEIYDALSVVPRSVYVIPGKTQAPLWRNRITHIGDAVAIEIQSEPLGLTARAIKRAFDLTASIILLVLLIPVFILVSLLIRLDSRGPILFRQTRRGLRGQEFRIFKFRSMRVLEDGPSVVQAGRYDRRVTRVGGLIRRLSIDELPQLLNVVSGEMSLVGPRPHAVAHDEQYSKAIPNYEIRQHVKPGITGWAQVNGLRGETKELWKMHRRIEFDIWYARNCSLLLDARILLLTVVEVFRQRNAY
ncbi:MAG TPA: exopolysaccharide biosynthesis polyprenyl glycosylphosphotransferase [Rhizomicrobium sp.]|nr:exopolysaccharide biosynthesis polyprenyl glycosylphosphotransferase [Rhizomicrobium sp.]